MTTLVTSIRDGILEELLARLKALPGYHVERRALFGDEEHSLALGKTAGKQVRDGLRLAGAWRPFQHEGAPTNRLGDRIELRRIGWNRAQGTEFVEIDIVECRYRIDESLGR